jgi:hypothetical protein
MIALEESFLCFKKIEKELPKDHQLISKPSLKTLYNVFRKEITTKPKLRLRAEYEVWEGFDDEVWNGIFSEIQPSYLSSYQRSLNYRIINDGLPTNNKFKETKERCYLCKKVKEDIGHLFVTCEITLEFLEFTTFKNIYDECLSSRILVHLHYIHLKDYSRLRK